MSDSPTFQVYIISASRYQRGMITARNFENYKHVVRKSQEQAYLDHGFDNVIAFDDELINRYSKVFEYLVANAPEDIIAIVDDDIDYFAYRAPFAKKIEDKEIVQAEFERLAQIIYDLDLGLAFGTVNMVPYMYTSEIKWVGTPGAWKIVNRKCIKAHMDTTIKRAVDIDYVMQEVLKNRVCLNERYFVSVGYRDKNTNTTGSIYSGKGVTDSIDQMKLKWGKYFDYDLKRNMPKINIKR